MPYAGFMPFRAGVRFLESGWKADGKHQGFPLDPAVQT